MAEAWQGSGRSLTYEKGVMSVLSAPRTSRMGRPRVLPIVLAAVAALGISIVPAGATASPAMTACPTPPSPQDPVANPAFYSYVHTYDGTCAAHTNWTRSFDDVTVSVPTHDRGGLSVTASTALGGALASLRLGGKELIASGGHGSAIQWAFHAWKAGGQASECYNPTQAGGHLDDEGKAAPYHGPSTSALYDETSISTASIHTASRPAMYVQRGDPIPGFGGCHPQDFQPNRSPYTFGLSPYWLDTTVQMGRDTGLGLDNVVLMTAHLTSEDDNYAQFDGVFVAYLQRDLRL
jgi:hypothetical protein